MHQILPGCLPAAEQTPATSNVQYRAVKLIVRFMLSPPFLKPNETRPQSNLASAAVLKICCFSLTLAVPGKWHGQPKMFQSSLLRCRLSEFLKHEVDMGRPCPMVTSWVNAQSFQMLHMLHKDVYLQIVPTHHHMAKKIAQDRKTQFCMARVQICPAAMGGFYLETVPAYSAPRTTISSDKNCSSLGVHHHIHPHP